MKQRPVIRGDALKWKAVQLPDRLDDAEGFYGLEEIDDVDVVRDERTQHVMFQPKFDEAVEEADDDDEADGDGDGDGDDSDDMDDDDVDVDDDDNGKSASEEDAGSVVDDSD